MKMEQNWDIVMMDHELIHCLVPDEDDLLSLCDFHIDGHNRSGPTREDDLGSGAADGNG
jgi:hypothetical protein